MFINILVDFHNVTDQQARDQVNLSDFAADIIKQTEKDYGKKMSTNGWGEVMDYLEDIIYDTKTKLSDSDRKMKIKDYIYQVYEEDTGIKDIYTANSVKCNYIGGNAIMRKKRFSVKASTTAKRRVLAMTDDEFYTREFPDVKVGEVKVKPHRGNYTVFIGLSDGTIAYQWCESKVKAEREAKYARGIVKKYGADDDYWTREGYRIWNPNVESGKAVKCARTKDTTVSKEDVTELVQFIINRQEMDKYIQPTIANLKKHVAKGNYSADDAIKSWQRVADEGCAQYSEVFVNNKHSYAWLNPATRKEIAKQLQKYYDEQVFEDVEASKSVNCSRTMRKRPMRSVKASTKRRFDIKASVGDSVDVDEIKQILRDAGVKTWGVKKSSYHGGDLIEIVFDDTNDYSKATSALEDAGFDVKFDSSNGANVYYFTIDDNREAEAYLYRVVFEYNNEVVPMDDKTNDYQAVLDACIDKMESESNMWYLYTYDEAMKYAREFADDEADVERIMEEEFVEGGNHGLYLFTAGNFNIIPIGFGKASEYVGSAVRCSRSMRRRSTRAIKASADYGSQSYKVLRVLRDYINMEFNKTMIGDVEVYVGDIYETANDSFAFDVSLDPKNDYERETRIKVVSSDELYAKDVFYCKVGLDTRDGGYFEISRFGAKDTLADKIDEIAESISSGDSVNSAKSIRCEDEDAEIVEDDFADDEDYEDDNAELTVDISNLELGEPFYEMREDDPENPDKWVLVIGKDAEKQMNFKLWYYVDSTDADLTALDLSNPDHIDLDEESMIEDYDEIQLATNVSCKDGCVDQRYDAGLVTM